MERRRGDLAANRRGHGLLQGILGKQRSTVLALITAFAVASVLVLVAWHELPYRSPDSVWYRQMAAGHADEVVRPYSTRILHAALIAFLAGPDAAGQETAFRIVGILSLLLLCGGAALLLRSGGVGLPVVVVLLGVPLFLLLFQDYYLPDLFHGALLVLFLLTLRRWTWPSLLLLFALVLTRETTALLSLVLIIYALRSGQRALALSVAGVTMAGLGLTWFGAARLGLVPSGLTGAVSVEAGRNAHGIGPILYLLLKLPFNLLRNLFGLRFWANTLDYCSPTVQWELPRWLARGAVHAVGFCGFSILGPLHLASYILTSLGLLPSLALLWIRRGRGLSARGSPAWLQCAWLYGLLTFLLTPAMGAAMDRIIVYGWPAFVLAAPLLAVRDGLIPREHLGRLAALHLGLSWSPYLLVHLLNDELMGSHIALVSVLIGIALPLHALSWKWIGGWRGIEAAKVVVHPGERA